MPSEERQKRRLRFGLRGMFVAVTIISCAFAIYYWLWHDLHMQQEAAEKLERAGCIVQWETGAGSWTADTKWLETPSPDWLVDLFGNDPASQLTILRCYDRNSVRVVADLTDALPYLQKLQIESDPRDKINDDDVRFIERMQELRILQFWRTGITDRTMAKVAGLRSLEWLEDSRSSISDEGIAELEHHQSLQHLSLIALDITDNSLNSIATIPRLKSLRLVECPVLENFDVLSNCRNLRWVDLSRTKITNNSLAALANLELRTLDLRDTTVDDKGLRELSGMKTLRTLNLNGTSVTQQGIEEIKRAIPNISIR